jgi:hypothetical protein
LKILSRNIGRACKDPKKKVEEPLVKNCMKRIQEENILSVYKLLNSPEIK